MTEILGYSELAGLVPERAPMLMLDRLEIDTAAECARAVKCVSMDEEFFQGHFPGNPIMPGVLQIAAMLQTAAALLRRLHGLDAAAAVHLREIRRLKFRKPVLPGDLLLVAVEQVNPGPDGAVALRARTAVNDQVACEGSLTLVLNECLEPALQSPLPTAVEPGPDCNPSTACDSTALMAMIPHRYPFFLIDRALSLDVDAMRLSVVKNVTGNEPFFRGLGAPIMPGFLQIEAAAQAACALALQVPANRNKLGYFMSVDEAVFFAPVTPGDQILIELDLTSRGRFGTAGGRISVAGRLVTQVALKFAIVDRPSV